MAVLAMTDIRQGAHEGRNSEVDKKPPDFTDEQLRKTWNHLVAGAKNGTDILGKRRRATVIWADSLVKEALES